MPREIVATTLPWLPNNYFVVKEDRGIVTLAEADGLARKHPSYRQCHESLLCKSREGLDGKLIHNRWHHIGLATPFHAGNTVMFELWGDEELWQEHRPAPNWSRLYRVVEIDPFWPYFVTIRAPGDVKISVPPEALSERNFREGAD